MSGVYQIYNTVNGKRYIGSSIHIEQRFKEHLRNLRANKIDPYADHAGNTLSEETRKKISEKAKGRKWSKEHHEKWSKIMTGRKKPKQSQTMKQKYANGESSLPRFNEVSEEKRKSWIANISKAVRKRYSDYSNRPKGYWLKVNFSNDVKYYPSLREASRQLGIDKGAIQYCFKRKQGYCGKLNCTFIQISKEEYEEATV